MTALESHDSAPSAEREKVGRRELPPPPLEFQVSPLAAEALREEYAQLSQDVEDDERRMQIAEQIDIAEGRAAYNQALAAHGASGDEDEWPQIRALHVSPFPLEALPTELGLYAENVAEHTQTPVDLAATVILGVLSTAALGLRVRVFWGTEELSLYVLLAAISGDRKSSVMNIVTAPLQKIIEEVREAERSDLLRAVDEVQELEKRRQTLHKRLTSAESNEERQELREQLHEAAVRLDDLAQPERYRLLAQDITPEALDRLLCQHGQQALISDEGGAVANALGQYNEGNPKLDGLCRAYTGGRHAIDRVGRDPLEAPRVLATLVFTVQDHILGALVGNQAARTQGLVGRFAFSLPESRQGRRLTTSTEIPALIPGLLAGWESTVRKVYAHKPVPKGPEAPPARRFGTFGTPSGTEVERTLSLSESAIELLDRVVSEQEPKLADGGEFEKLRDWIARHPSRITRIAALLHLAAGRDPGEPISGTTMASAVQIGEYFLAHSAAALLEHDPIMRRTMRWLTRHPSPTVTRRELRRGPLRSRDTPGEIDTYIEGLCARGALRGGRVATGGRPSEVYEINPNLRAESTERAEVIAHDHHPRAESGSA